MKKTNGKKTQRADQRRVAVPRGRARLEAVRVKEMTQRGPTDCQTNVHQRRGLIISVTFYQLHCSFASQSLILTRDQQLQPSVMDQNALKSQ